MAPARSIPFLKLAEFPASKALEHLDTEDLLEFSLLSRRARAAVQTHTARRTEKLEMDILNFYRVRITKSSDEQLFAFEFPNPRSMGTENWEDADETRTFDGTEMTFARIYEEDCYRWFCCTEKQQEFMLAVVNHCKVVLNCKLYQLRITLRDTDDIDLYFKDPFFQTATSLDIGFGAVTANEMTGFFDHFPAKQKKFWCYPGRAYQYDKPITLNVFDIREAQWMTRSNLLNLDCKKVDIRKSCFKSEDFNAFIVNWMMTDNYKLEYICIIGKADNDFLNMNKAMEDIECDVGTQKRHNLTSYRPRIHPQPDYQIGMDVRRKTDGLLGTVVIDELPNGLARFLFVAWHVLDPNWQ